MEDSILCFLHTSCNIVPLIKVLLPWDPDGEEEPASPREHHRL